MKKKIILVGILSLLVYSQVYRFNKNAAASYIQENAENKSKCWCAWYVMKGLIAGGCPAILLPAHAYEYYLPLVGFEQIHKENYNPEIGDIIVFPSTKGHIWGHIQMWTGAQWASDFKQKHMIPAKAYHNVSWKIFRYKNSRLS